MKPLTKKWRTFQFWNRLGITLVLVFLPALIGAALFAHWAGLKDLSLVVFPLVILWVALFVAAYFHIRTFPCPRCVQPFTVRNRWAANTRGRECVHCGLELYADAQPTTPGDAPHAARS